MPEPRLTSLRIPTIDISPALARGSRTPAQRRGDRRPLVQAPPVRIRRVPPPVRNLPRRYGN